MKVVVVVCAFGLTVSEVKTETMCLRRKGMPESTATLSVEATDQVYNQMNELVYLGGNANHNADLSIEVSRRIRNVWCSFRKYTLELYDRRRASLELKIRMLRAEKLETMLYGCVTWSPRACQYDTLRQAHHSFLTRCIGCRKNDRADHSIFYLDTLIETGSESIEATLRKRRILFAGFVARMEDTRLPKRVMFGELVRGVGCVGATKKSGWGLSWTTSEPSASTPTSGRLQPRTRGSGAGPGTRGGTFHGEMDRCRESQGWTMACSSMTQCDGKDHGEDSPKQAGSYWFARHVWLATYGANLFPPGGCRVVFLWCYFCFVLFRFFFFLSLKPWPFHMLRSIVLQYDMCAPRRLHTL